MTVDTAAIRAEAQKWGGNQALLTCDEAVALCDALDGERGRWDAVTRFVVLSVGAIIGGVVSRVIFPYEPGLTFVLYGGAGGLVGGCAALSCYRLARTLRRRMTR